MLVAHIFLKTLISCQIIFLLIKENAKCLNDWKIRIHLQFIAFSKFSNKPSGVWSSRLHLLPALDMQLPSFTIIGNSRMQHEFCWFLQLLAMPPNVTLYNSCCTLLMEVITVFGRWISKAESTQSRYLQQLTFHMAPGRSSLLPQKWIKNCPAFTAFYWPKPKLEVWQYRCNCLAKATNGISLLKLQFLMELFWAGVLTPPPSNASPQTSLTLEC